MRKLLAFCFTVAVPLLSACSTAGSAVPAGQAIPMQPAISAVPAATRQHIYVAQGDYYNKVPGAVSVFALTANGNVAPTWTLSGSKTMLRQPRSIAIDSTGRVYTANQGENANKPFSWDNKIFVFAPTARGNVAPEVTMSGLTSPTAEIDGLTFDRNDNVYVLRNNACTCIYAYKAGVWPKAKQFRNVQGSYQDSWSAGGFDASGNFYISVDDEEGSANYGFIAVYGPKGSGAINPIRTISGYDTQLDASAGPLVYDPNFGGRLIVEEAAIHILVFPANATGDTAPTATITPTSPKLGHLDIVGVAVDAAGYIYAVDAGDNAILKFAPNGNGNVAPMSIVQGGSTKLNRPSAITIR